MQIYEEAESNANAFAFACLFSPSETGGLGLMDTTGETGDASLTACIAEAQQYFCRRQTSQKPRVAWRASQGVDGYPVCTRGGEGKCYGFTTNRFTFPGRTGEGCRQNGRRAESAIPPLGESATVSRQISSLPPPRRQMYACRTCMTENTVSCFVFHVAGLELFMKTAGATANRQIYTKHCKSMHHADRS